jgi:hypothetical protein
MAPVGVAGAGAVTGSADEVAAPATSGSVVDEVAAGASVLSDEVSDEVSDEADDDDDVVEVDEDDEVVFLVDVGLGLTVDISRVLSPLCVIWALMTAFVFLAPQ